MGTILNTHSCSRRTIPVVAAEIAQADIVLWASAGYADECAGWVALEVVALVDIVVLEGVVVVVGALVADVVVDLVVVLLVEFVLLVPDAVPVGLKDPTYSL